MDEEEVKEERKECKNCGHLKVYHNFDYGCEIMVTPEWEPQAFFRCCCTNFEAVKSGE